MIKDLLRFKTKHPFLFIMAIGLVLRVIAAFFSKGFGMHDDHFLVIEQAQSWVDGGDYQKWLPGTEGNEGPEGHSFFYVGFQYLFFHFLQFFGIHDPQWKMLFVRIFHAGISMFVISFGYRIASLITAKDTAYKVALLLAVFWFMPFLSVRNMVELTCIPFLMYGTLIILRQEQIRKDNLPGYHKTSFLVAGFFLGLAFSVRYQTIVYAGGIGLAVLILGNWRGMLSTAIGFLISTIIFQGFIDFLIWGKPFAELTEYVSYNLDNAYEYHTAPWYNYIILLAALLIPPVSLMLIWGYLRSWKKYFLLFFPVLLFIVFHSIFPNKQERFILPVIPMFIVLGLAGWQEWVNGSTFWKKNKSFLNGSWLLFWAINIALLLFFTPMYSKKARVESMSYLKNYSNIDYFLIDDYGSNVLRFPPVFYTNQWPSYDAIYKDISYKDFSKWKDWEKLENQPTFVLFYKPDNLASRVDSLKQVFPGLVFEATIQPGFMDRLIHRINPINANEEIHIYRNKARIPEKNKL
jgi:hypothetical protein